MSNKYRKRNDLIGISGDHRNRGRIETESQKAQISQSMKDFIARQNSGAGMILGAVDVKTGDTIYFESCAEAARALGCSKQLISAASRTYRTGQFSARGYVFEWRMLEVRP